MKFFTSQKISKILSLLLHRAVKKLRIHFSWSSFQNVIRGRPPSYIDFATICFQVEETDDAGLPKSDRSMPVKPIVATSDQNEANGTSTPIASTAVTDFVILVSRNFFSTFWHHNFPYLMFHFDQQSIPFHTLFNTNERLNSNYEYVGVFLNIRIYFEINIWPED